MSESWRPPSTARPNEQRKCPADRVGIAAAASATSGRRLRPRGALWQGEYGQPGSCPSIEVASLRSGTLGTDVDVATGARSARIAALNALAAAAELAGGLDEIERALGLVVDVACGSEFREHPAVADGASLLLTDVLGEAGRHVRSNVGCTALPLGSPVEIELVVETAV